jgi:hypothetical protein
MRASEILRQMADMIDAKSQPQQPEDHQHHSADDLIPVPTDIFLPPLQGKYELLKKAVGVENEFDENAHEQDQGDAGNYRVTPMTPDETDALERMKKAAGVNALITHELADDEPLD